MKNYTGQSNFTGILICQENRANGPRASKTIFFWGKGWKSVNLGETNRHMKQKTTMLSVKSCLGMRICAHTHVDLLFSPLIAGIRKSHICHFFFFSFSEQKNPCLLNPCQMNQTCVRKGSGHTVPYECECPPGFYGAFCEKTFTIYANEMTGTWHFLIN